MFSLNQQILDLIQELKQDKSNLSPTDKKLLELCYLVFTMARGQDMRLDEIEKQHFVRAKK